MAHQVADLVEQFVRLDAFLMDFIFEAALKLASLTDGQLFMMIETSEGRRFAGKEHLCDLYLSGGLKPIGSEMKYHLDSYVPSISKELVDPPPPTNSSFNHVGGESDLRIPNTSSTSSVMPIIGSSSTRSLKRRNREGSAAASASASSMSPPKSARLSSTSLQAVDVSNGADFEAVDASTRGSERTSASSSVVKRLDVVKNEVEEEDIFLIDDDDTEGGGVKGDLNHSDLDFSAVDFNSTGDMQHQRHQHQMDLDSLNSAAFDESHDSAVNEFLGLNPKAHALAEIPPTSFDANSAGLKLLNSLAYDYAKYMSEFCPADDFGNLLHREFFAAIFDKFWTAFPNLHVANEESFKALDLLRKSDRSKIKGNKGWGLKTKTRSDMSSLFLRFVRKAKGLRGIVNLN